MEKPYFLFLVSSRCQVGACFLTRFTIRSRLVVFVFFSVIPIIFIDLAIRQVTFKSDSHNNTPYLLI